MKVTDIIKARERLKNVKSSINLTGAVISTVDFDCGPRAVFNSNDFNIRIISRGEKNTIFWFIKDNNIDGWKSAVRICAETGVGKYILIGQADDFQDVLTQTLIVSDHINVSGENPLIGKNDDSLGTRFPDMSGLYDRDLSDYLKMCCDKLKLTVSSGILLIPKAIHARSDLEKRILRQQKDVVISKDIFAGAIVAKHQALRSAGLIFGPDIDTDKRCQLLDCLAEGL